MSGKAVFLDKDGTLLENVPYNVDPALMRFADGAAEGVQRLERAGFDIFVITNQSGVARGYFPESALAAVEASLREMLARLGVELSGFSYCPHDTGAPPTASSLCDCRKPSPGMVLRALEQHGLDAGRSWMVGDILDDIECGKRAGCRTVLVGPEASQDLRLLPPLCRPDLTARDLGRAAALIETAALYPEAGAIYSFGGAP